MSRSLTDKLGVKPKSRVLVCGIEPHFHNLLESLLEHPPLTNPGTGTFDLIFLHVDAVADLKAINKLAERLKPSGALWIVHPKGRGASPTDAEVRAAGIASGLVDNKISAYSDTHTSTRFVIPLARRAVSSRRRIA